ncbi:MAG: DNA helicase RecQ [Halanaerobiales bacterium]|nr:DNA helicase RecQ [Halanaerobiales bacterium]
MLENAQNLLKKYYGYSTFRDGQKKVIQSILEGKDTFAIMPTGAGKSICYQIPALLLPGLTLVISPLISLMKDQVDSLQNNGIPATFINSSLKTSEVQDRLRKAQDGFYKLLYVAPERLESQQFCHILNSLEISLLAVDEAHCVSQWGHDFRPSYRFISTMLNQIPVRPIVSAFTATATEEVKEDVVGLLKLTNPNVYVTGFDRPNLSFAVIKAGNKNDFILNYIEDRTGQSGIIYAATRKEVDRLYENLRGKGYRIGKYHAGLSDNDRKKTQEAFLYDDDNIIVATNAFGMGIDKSNVRYVIHNNIPKNMEAYYQEAGRAGRDGEPSECLLLFAAQDIHVQKFLIEQSVLSPQRKVEQYKKLQAMIDYCHTPRCLRKYILEYFGEKNVFENCGNCSTCNDDSDLSDITIEAQKIFSCVYRMNQRWGTALVAQVLKGSRNKKVLENGFDQLSTHGIMQGYTIKEVRDMINILIAEEYLGLTDGQFPVVRLREKAGAVLKNEEKVFQKIQKRKEKVATDNSLFEILRSLRKEISMREQVPPYIVFQDSSLREMCEYFPIDEASMLTIKGVGEAKLNKYGEEFINVIRNYVEENGLMDRVSASYDNTKNSSKDKTPSHLITLKLYQTNNLLENIARIRDIKLKTVQEHLIQCSCEGLDVNLDVLIPEEHEAFILKVIDEIGGQKLKPIKEALPKEIDYIAIKAVLCKYKNVNSSS